MDTIAPIQIPCPVCSSLVDTTAFFCPICGKNLKEKPLSTGIGTQIGLYAVSVLLPPLFIGRTIKYLKSAEPKAKQIGVISLILTIVVLLTTILLSISVAKNMSREVNLQMKQYQDLGL